MAETISTHKIHTLFKPFTEHPARVNETYLEHMMFAFRFAFRLFRAGTAALVHACVPALCETTASQQIETMYAEMQRRRARPLVE